MNDRLEAYYERELERLYAEAGDFAKRRGKIAARLELGDRGSSDPHVERLLQGFAFVAAGIRQRLDEDFPLLSETLLSSLYPHLLRPRPAMAVVRLRGTPSAAVAGGYAVPEGSSLSATAADGSERIFRTCRDVRLFPVNVEEAALMPLSPGLAETAAARIPPDAAYVLRLRLTMDAPGVALGALRMQNLRLYLRAPEHAVPQIYSLLRESRGAHVYDADDNLLGAARVSPVGFAPDDGMVPYAPPTPWGYRMAADYFSFPEKFHFFDVEGLPSPGSSREMVLRIFCPPTPPDLEVSAENFLTGCVPVVNLFDRDLHVSMNHETPEYRLAVPADAGAGARVYSVNRVVAAPAGGGRPFDVDPFYPFAPAAGGRVFHLERRRGEEAYLSFTDLRGGAERWETSQVSVSVTCCHGADAAPLPAGAEFRLRERQTVVDGVSVVSGPTRCVFPPGGREAHWRLMSHLALNHLSLSGGAEGAGALVEMLRLYDWSGDADNSARIASIRSVESRMRLLRPAEGGEDLADCFLGGVEVEVALRDDRAGDALFASVLEAFVSGHAALNTPVRVVIRSEQRGGREWRFPLRMGRRRLI